MKRVKSKKTGEVFTVVREDEKGFLFSDGRVRKHKTVAEYFEEVGDAESLDDSRDADAERGAGEVPGGRLGSNDADNDLPSQDGEGEAGPDTPPGGYGPGDADSVLEV